MNYESIWAAALVKLTQAAGTIWGMRENHDEDKPIHVPATLQAFPNWLQVSEIHLRSMDLSRH